MSNPTRVALQCTGLQNRTQRITDALANQQSKKTGISGQSVGVRGKNRPGNPNHCRRRLVPDTDGPETPCGQKGILGALIGLTCPMRLPKALREILCLGTNLAGRLPFYDVLGARVRITRLRREHRKPADRKNRAFGNSAFIECGEFRSWFAVTASI